MGTALVSDCLRGSIDGDEDTYDKSIKLTQKCTASTWNYYQEALLVKYKHVIEVPKGQIFV